MTDEPRHFLDLTSRERVVVIALSTLLLAALAVRWAMRSDPWREQPEVVHADIRADHRIDLNTATVEQLCWLPGIGVKYAEAIVKYREKNGPFATPDELVNVRQIGQSLVDGIREYVVVSEGKSGD